MLESKFKRGEVNKNIFIKKPDHEILLVQIYVDDIMFSATDDSLCNEFSKIMPNEFEMSVMG